MTFEQLTLRLDEWRKQRNLADPKAQTMKVMEGLDPTKCLESAWQVIVDRKGRTVDGTFIKAEDLTNADL